MPGKTSSASGKVLHGLPDLHREPASLQAGPARGGTRSRRRPDRGGSGDGPAVPRPASAPGGPPPLGPGPLRGEAPRRHNPVRALRLLRLRACPQAEPAQLLRSPRAPSRGGLRDTRGPGARLPQAFGGRDHQRRAGGQAIQRPARRKLLPHDGRRHADVPQDSGAGAGE